MHLIHHYQQAQVVQAIFNPFNKVNSSFFGTSGMDEPKLEPCSAQPIEDQSPSSLFEEDDGVNGLTVLHPFYNHMTCCTKLDCCSEPQHWPWILPFKMDGSPSSSKITMKAIACRSLTDHCEDECYYQGNHDDNHSNTVEYPEKMHNSLSWAVNATYSAPTTIEIRS